MSEEENSSGVPSLGHGLEYDLWEGQFQFVGIDGADDGVVRSGGGVGAADDDDDVVVSGDVGRSNINGDGGDSGIIDLDGIVINNRGRNRRRTVIRIGDPANVEENVGVHGGEGNDYFDDDNDDVVVYDDDDDDDVIHEGGGLLDIFRDRNGNNRSATIGDKQQQLQQINGVVKTRKKKAWSADLNEKVQVLQEQMSVLTDNQNHSDERYTRAKQENAALQARVIILEEQLREVELRAQEKLQDEERRHRELVVRVDREKQLQVENCAIRLQSLELENSSLRAEAARCRAQAEKLRAEVQRLEEEQGRNEATIAALKEELETLREKERWNSETSQANQQLIEELTQEIERLRAEQRDTLEQLNSRGNGVSPTAHEQLQAKFSQLREDNRRLQEAHDELQALLLTKSVEEGRSLLTEHQSLAAELEAMSQDEPAPASTDDLEVRTALKEQQEVNAQLRSYIDGILLNIVDNYPQLLEVKGGLP